MCLGVYKRACAVQLHVVALRVCVCVSVFACVCARLRGSTVGADETSPPPWEILAGGDSAVGTGAVVQGTHLRNRRGEGKAMCAYA